MINQLKSLAIFVQVVESGSFRKAAEQLKMSPSAVSDHVKNLENQVGLPLLYRSTRSLSLTDDGKQLLGAAKSMVTAANEGLQHFSTKAADRLLELKVAVPYAISCHPVSRKLVEFTKAHKGIRLTVLSSDTMFDLVEYKCDIAIRMGNLADSDFISKKIGEDDRVTVASPDYMRGKPEPKHPNDLRDMDFIAFTPVPNAINLTGPNSEHEAIWGATAVRVDSIGAMRRFAVHGAGIAGLPRSSIEYDIDNDRLVELLPDWSGDKLGIYLVWHKSAALKPATRSLIDYMSG